MAFAIVLLLIEITDYINMTRMHSSRMRTGRSLTVCCSLLPVVGGGSGPGGVCLVRGGVCSGGTWSGGVSAPGGCLVWGGGFCSGGVSQHALRQTPSLFLWTEFLTHACENITLAQLRCGR